MAEFVESGTKKERGVISPTVLAAPQDLTGTSQEQIITGSRALKVRVLRLRKHEASHKVLVFLVNHRRH
jgi:hypothetical protein